jgi:hypothetical protein
MELAMNKVIVGILALIFLFTVGIVLYLYTGDPIGTLSNAFEELTTSDALTREEKTEYTVNAYNKFTENINEHCNGKETNNCFCFSKTQGSITGESYMLIKNSDSSSTISLINDEQTYLTNPQTQDYEIGLFTLGDNGGDRWTLDCTYPDQFFIVGKDVSETPYVNHWTVVWKLDGLDEDGYEFYGNTHYEGGWTGDKKITVGSITGLENVPYMYKVDENHICLLTTLIEVDDLDSGATLNLGLASIGSDGWVFKDPKDSDIVEFFTVDNYNGDSTEEIRYCNKEYSS